MQIQSDIDDIKARRICIDCIGESYLSAKVEQADEKDTCHYCEAEDTPTIAIEELAGDVAGAFERHFQRTPMEPDGFEYSMMKEGLLDWERHGDPVTQVIAEAALIDDDAAEDVRRVLEYENEDMERDQMGEEGPFDEDAHYQEADINDAEFRAAWKHFEQELTTETRFFNKAAEAVLAMVFQDIAVAKNKIGQTIIRTCGPGTGLTALYRARVFTSDGKLEDAIKSPDREVGAPPTWAAAAGRMNARGISVFYGATEETIALAEVRPPVGSRVAVGRFEIIRSVRLLDVAALQSLIVEGSVFNPQYARQLERARFLKRLGARITMPVMPDDEAMSHLVTQAMADYLVGRTDLNLDGILYPSVQADEVGHNVVLFHRSARCEAIEVPAGTDVKASLYHHSEDGPEADYWVWEAVPVQLAEKPKDRDGFPDFELLLNPREVGAMDLRSVTLRVDTAALKVHHIRAVTFKTDVHDVKRHRTQQHSKEEF